jgi:hypothetical protein
MAVTDWRPRRTAESRQFEALLYGKAAKPDAGSSAADRAQYTLWAGSAAGAASLEVRRQRLPRLFRGWGLLGLGRGGGLQRCGNPGGRQSAMAWAVQVSAAGRGPASYRRGRGLLWRGAPGLQPFRAAPFPPRVHCEVRRRRVVPGRDAGSGRRRRRPLLHRLPGSDLAGKGEGDAAGGPAPVPLPVKSRSPTSTPCCGSQDRRCPDLSGVKRCEDRASQGGRTEAAPEACAGLRHL